MEQDKRECGSCTKCCEGWLNGEAYGHKFYPGQPCFFKKEGGCSIYKDRPENPCKSYKCLWLTDENIPHWMKPDQINAILTHRIEEGIGYIDVTEAGEKLRVEVLNWIVMFALNKKANLQYKISGGVNRIGVSEFTAAKQSSPKTEITVRSAK